MSDAADDPQGLAEALDSDKVGTPDDHEVEPDYPFDELLGADEFGTAPVEEHMGESVDERSDRETVDPLAAELDDAPDRAPAEIGDATVGTALDELELELDDDTLAEIDRIEPLVPDADTVDEELASTEEVGRLVEPGVGDDVQGIDDEAESVARSYAQTDLSAEEAAVHLDEEPPG
jgi:hypothetical protein